MIPDAPMALPGLAMPMPGGPLAAQLLRRGPPVPGRPPGPSPAGPAEVIRPGSGPDPLPTGPLPLVPVAGLLNPAAAARSAAIIRGSVRDRGGRARSRSPPGDPGAASSSDPIYADPAPAYRGRRTIPASFRDYIPGNLVRFKNGRAGFVLAQENGPGMSIDWLPGVLSQDDIARIPLYDPNDEEAKARYKAAARRSQMS